MSGSRFKVTLKERHMEVPEGTTVGDIFGRNAVREHGIVAATLNHGLVSLRAVIQGPCRLHPVLATEPMGRTVRRRTICHMLQALVANRGDKLQLKIGQSIAGGYFYEVEGGAPGLSLEQLAKDLSGGLHHLAEAVMPFNYLMVTLDGARRLLTDPSGTKKELLETWPTPMLTLVGLGKFVDIPHGPYAPDTSIGANVKVIPYDTGILLDFKDNGNMPPPERSQQLLSCYRQTAKWNRHMGIETVGQLNRAILEEREQKVIRIGEALHEKRIANIADEVAFRSVRFVCIAGPSSSGKTTFMSRLSDQLQVNGITAHHISLDDYYLDRSKCPRDEDGRFDFESPDALNLPLLHKHFKQLLDGREIMLPKFDFANGESIENFRPFKLGPNDVAIVEGIHGNNPMLTAPLPEASRYRIFVNALNQLRIDDHNRILTSDTRLLRRLVRDRLYRATSAEETIFQWKSVLAGEKRYIYPYQDHTDTMFNSAMVYETPILKTFAQRFLLEVPRRSAARVHAYRLLRFLDLFVPLLPSHIPQNSILREFIGQRI